MRTVTRLLLLIGLVASVMCAGPVVLYSNFGPGDSYFEGPGVTFGCGAMCWGNDGLTLAWAFTPGVTATFTELETVATSMFAPTSLIASIWTDSGGVPGAMIESLSTPLDPTFTHFDFLSVLHPTLTAGTTYWFVAAVPDPVNDAAQLALNSIGATGPQAYMWGAGPWADGGSNLQAVFRVTGDVESSVPEPSSLALIVAAMLGGLMGLRRRPFA